MRLHRRVGIRASHLVTAALLVLLVLAFNLPASWAEMGTLRSWAVPLELAAAVALVRLVPPRRRTVTANLLGLALAVLLTVRLADNLLWRIMGRELTLALDLPLAGSLLELGAGSLGLSITVLLAAAALFLPLLIWLLATSLLRRAGAFPLPKASGPALAALLLGCAAAAPVTPLGEGDPPLTSAHGLAQASTQIARARSARTAARRWDAASAADPAADIPADGLLARLRDVDVIVVFVESYGRTAIETEPFAATIGPRLAAFERSLGEHDLAAASGWLVSPTEGGGSWLAHATLASGVEIADEAAHRVYEARVSSDLAHLFARQGHRTVLIEPALVHPYPQAARLGFTATFLAADLGYRGPAMGWVTMPDQFTLAAFERLARPAAHAERVPVFAQVVLVGSHAPFTPRASLVAWDEVGDGRVFGALPVTGGSALEVWADAGERRGAYAAALDLSLASLQGFAARVGDRSTLLILVGDHEPAAFVTGRPGSRTVPIHAISGDPALLEPFRAWGFGPGLRPPDAPARPMAAFRAFLVEAFSERPSPAASAGARRPDRGGGA